MYDKDFLQQLYKSNNRKIFAKVTALTLEELPIEAIEGHVTAGSVNLDGVSAMRRTCNLTLAASVVYSALGEKKINISDNLWGLKTKFKLEVGLGNDIDLSYPEIIWFDQGIFIISSFTQSLSASNFNINIQGKDKMSLLNGEMGGSINSSVDFGKIEEIDKYGNRKFIEIPVKQIIRDIVHQYGGEPFHKIIINDLEDKGLQLKNYAYDTPLYLFGRADDEHNNFINCTLNAEQNCIIAETDKITTISDPEIIYENLNQPLLNEEDNNSTLVYFDKKNELYRIAKVSYGETVGYVETDLTYPGTLSANIGENVVSVLDKIKNFLGDFEYFYDVYGNFIFQKKRDWINTSWSPVETDDYASYVQDLAAANPYSYIFNDSQYFTTFNNTPNYANVKNDFTVWGKNSNNLPIHMRYAIDVKPQIYISLQVRDDELKEYNEINGFTLLGQESVIYMTKEAFENSNLSQEPYFDIASNYIILNSSELIKDQEEYYIKFNDCETIIENNEILIKLEKEIPKICICDWREIIYQMGQDYRKYNHLEDFYVRLQQINGGLYLNGITGYEQYYIDLEGFWRQLYNPEIQYQRVYIDNFEENTVYYVQNKNPYTQVKITSENPNDHIKYYIKIDEDKYIRATYPYTLDAIYYIKNEEYLPNKNSFSDEEKYYIRSEQYYYPADYTTNEPATTENPNIYYWNKNIFQAPELLLFWFDFLDVDGELDYFSVKSIGSRAKAVNDNNVRAIHYKDVPYVIFEDQSSRSDNSKEVSRKSGYRYFNIGKTFSSMFATSSQGKSAKGEIENLMYNHSYLMESVTITSIPIYDLELNTRIFINDPNLGIVGDYIVSKLTLPLAYNGTMNITATKAAERLL